MEYHFTNQGHAEDVVNRHRYLYYVCGQPLLEDWEYDELERAVKARWSVSCVTHEVGSGNACDYAGYIVHGVRPMGHERTQRDRAIVERWVKALLVLLYGGYINELFCACCNSFN